MSIAVLEWQSKSIPVKIEKAEAIITATGNPTNPNFQPPNEPTDPTLPELTIAVGELKTASQNSENAGGGKVLNSIVAEKEKALDILMPKFVAFIQAKSGGDALKIQSAGLRVKKEAEATQELGQVEGMIALVAENGEEGAVDLDWDNLKHATAYNVRMREAVPAAAGSETPADPGSTVPVKAAVPGPWRPAGESGTVTKSKMRVTGLVSGTRYEFQACGINGKGKGGWSDPAFRIAP